MSKIILSYRLDTYRNKEIPTYSLSFYGALIEKGHEVLRIGEGWEYKYVEDIPGYKDYSLFIDLDCGRDNSGKLHFRYQDRKPPIPSVVRLIDTHGHPSLHHRISRNYDHVFFAVWARRDLFANHPSAHFCPNASDDKYFDYQNHLQTWWNPEYDVAFFGTKHGLDRADILKEICEKNNWKYDIREVGRAGKPRWPRTAEAMSNSKVLWNHGQKHDINQRVFESMLINKPLITDLDSESGLEKLFTEGKHFLGYRSKEELEIQLKWCIKAPKLPQEMARKAYALVKDKHLVKNRVEQILEVCEIK